MYKLFCTCHQLLALQELKVDLKLESRTMLMLLLHIASKLGSCGRLVPHHCEALISSRTYSLAINGDARGHEGY